MFPGIADSFSSRTRPVLRGSRGAVSAAHPLAVAAGQLMLAGGGSAADAAIASQAVLCVLAPDACGLGGDMFALVGQGEQVIAVNGSGAAPRRLVTADQTGANSVTVPGIAGAWGALHRRWGRLPLAQVLGPAIRLAELGHPVSSTLAEAVRVQARRLEAGGADSWALTGLAVGERFVQPQLAALLRALADEGADSFYCGATAAAIASTIARHGGALDKNDLADHRTELADPIATEFGGVSVFVQPPPTQGVLLAMSLRALAGMIGHDPQTIEHLCVELTEAAFAFRDRVAEGRALFDVALAADPARAARRGGPRAYLHTAGVSTADEDGLVVSSLVSVFDDFGSCVYVPELGITLNNRAGGFTAGDNAAAPGRRPVHTLAPAMLRTEGGLLALATPGADGQVQTLLQLIRRLVTSGEDLASAIAAPRWRSEGGELLIEADHPGAFDLARRGHGLRRLTSGDMRFGAIACAGHDPMGPYAVADWRRDTWAGTA